MHIRSGWGVRLSPVSRTIRHVAFGLASQSGLFLHFTFSRITCVQIFTIFTTFLRRKLTWPDLTAFPAFRFFRMSRLFWFDFTTVNPRKIKRVERIVVFFRRFPPAGLPVEQSPQPWVSSHQQNHYQVQKQPGHQVGGHEALRILENTVY